MCTVEFLYICGVLFHRKKPLVNIGNFIQLNTLDINLQYYLGENSKFYL